MLDHAMAQSFSLSCSLSTSQISARMFVHGSWRFQSTYLPCMAVLFWVFGSS